MSNARKLMITMRLVYLSAILLWSLSGNWHILLFHGLIFAGSLFVPYLGKQEESYYYLDCLIVLTFLLSMVGSYYAVWRTPETVWQSATGIDKLFHTAGGAALGMFAAIVLRKRVTSSAVFYVGIVTFALAIGGAWEFFEWAVSLLPPPLGAASSGYMDSMLDLVADTLGAIIVAVVLWFRHWQ